MSGDPLLVQRLDGGSDYYLVVLFTSNRVVAVAAVDAENGHVRESARIANGTSPIQVSAEEAVKISRTRSVRAAELVWQPSRATRSPLYPVWRVSGETVVYVDQSGKVWRDLN